MLLYKIVEVQDSSRLKVVLNTLDFTDIERRKEKKKKLTLPLNTTNTDYNVLTPPHGQNDYTQPCVIP